MKYKVELIHKHTTEVIVEADSEEEAEQLALDNIEDGTETDCYYYDRNISEA